MNSFKTLNNITGWLVFAIATVVYYFSVESTGSLWDCGEFITGAYKLQVVHPPGAPLFILIGRIFISIGQLFSDKPEIIAISVNMMSAICTALAAMFICWTTVILGKICLVGRENEPENMGQSIALMGAGLAAGLATAFSTSNWFSAVEGEVYAMSTFFTAMVIWAVVKWYNLPDNKDADRWLLFAVFAAALSIGVHLLSLLTFPALALFYYFKKYKNHTLMGTLMAGLIGVVSIVLIQSLIITGIPKLWAKLEMMMVNGVGMSYNSGLIPLFIILFGISYYLLRYTHRTGNGLLQKVFLSLILSAIGFSVIGVVVIRANANPPINMNNPSNAMDLLTYLNREQYGERALFRGPNYDARPTGQTVEERYGPVGNKYVVVNRKIDYTYRPTDMVLFPRMGDYQPERIKQYQAWLGEKKGTPTFGDNMTFFLRYQLGWMYWRYFMWNFVGRQNGEQGMYSWDKRDGHWISGIKAIDDARLYKSDNMPDVMKNDMARNTYYFLPLIFGLIGLFYHLQRRREEFLAMLGLFIITGIGIIVYSNQPPNEPRERDYVLVGSFFTFCVWIGLGVVAIYELLSNRLKVNGMAAAPLAAALVLTAPAIMGFQNFDDHSRRGHTAARDYASNFLESCEKNAIIFTYGDNDTYPLWYAQEVENIRPDVRVVNLSLIAVDWYIEQLRRKVNDAPPIKLSISKDAYRGYKRNQIPIYSPDGGGEKVMDLREALKFVGEDHPVGSGSDYTFESYMPTSSFVLPINTSKMIQNGLISAQDTGVADKISFSLPIPADKENKYILKDDLAVLDVIASNIEDRPIYFAVTCVQNKLQGLNDWMSLEGLATRIVPIQTPSDPQFPGTPTGNGAVNTDKVLQNVLNKFKWGNFDKQKMFVDRSYMPSVQSHRFVILRSAMEMIKKGQNDKAVQMLDKYFEAFPDMNFPYDYSTLYMINAYMAAQAYPKAKVHLEKLADKAQQYLRFYASLSPSEMESFEQDQMLWLGTVQQMMEVTRQAKDTQLEQKMREMFSPFVPTKEVLDGPSK